MRPVPSQTTQLINIALTYKKWGRTASVSWPPSSRPTHDNGVFTRAYHPLPEGHGWFYREPFLDAIKATIGDLLVTLESDSVHESGDFIVPNLGREPGDFIVINSSPGDNRYYIGGAKFKALYLPEKT